MNILALCSALNHSYLAIKYNDEIIDEIIMSDENYHSLYLISKIKEICTRYDINLNKLEAITVNCGPGSFTGIRVAMSVAKVMAGELDLPLIGLDTANILLNAYNKDVLLMDARRDMYFVGTKEKIELVYKDKLPIFENKSILCEVVDCLNDAVKIAYESAKSGYIILLSPAHASWDQYDSFEVRGNEFKKIVSELK